MFPVIPVSERKIEPPRDLAPQDRGGFISPNLQSLRDNPRRTAPQEQQLRDIERTRARPIPQVEIPVLRQPTGQPQIAHRNNNPGNLEFINQPNAVRNGRFARFDTVEDGVVALQQKLRQRAAEGKTIETFLHQYAPAFENDTEGYIRKMERAFGVNRNTPINQLDFNQLTSFMTRNESSSRVTGYNNPLPRVNQNVPADRTRRD